MPHPMTKVEFTRWRMSESDVGINTAINWGSALAGDRERPGRMGGTNRSRFVASIETWLLARIKAYSQYGGAL